MAAIAQVQEPRPANRANRAQQPRWSRNLIFAVAAIYFGGPAVAAFWFSIWNRSTGIDFHAYTGLFDAPGFARAFGTSLGLGIITVVVTLALLLPTMLLVHLRYPKLRPIIEIVSLLPLVIPAVSLVVGVRRILAWGNGDQFAGTVVQAIFTGLQDTSLPLILACEYVILALPFTYRAIDAGLRTSSITTLIEAGRSLGASWPVVITRIVAPALRTSVLNAGMLGFASVVGEYTVAKILLFPTFTVWLQEFGVTDGQLQVALAFLSLLLTWLILLTVNILATGPKMRHAPRFRKAMK